MSAAPESLPAPKIKISRKQRRQMRLIREQQEKTTPFIPKASFHRLISETCGKISNVSRFSEQAKAALQVAAEDEITQVMIGANALATHAGRDTLHAEDIQLFCNLRNL